LSGARASIPCRLFAAKSLFIFFFLSLFAFLVLKLRVVLSPDSGAVSLPSWGRTLYGAGGGAPVGAAPAGSGDAAAAARAARPGDAVALRLWAPPASGPACSGALCGGGAPFFFAGTPPLHAVELRLVELYQMALRSEACGSGGALPPGGGWWCAPAGGGAPAMVADLGSGTGLLPLYAAASGARAVAVDARPHCALALGVAAAASGLGGMVRAVTAGAGAAGGASAPLRGGCGDAVPPLASEGAPEEVPPLSAGALLRELAAAGAAAGRPPGEGVLLARLDLGAEGVPVLARLAEEGVLGERVVKHWALVGVGPGCSGAACVAPMKATLAAAGYVEAGGAWGSGGLGEGVVWMSAPSGGAAPQHPPPPPVAQQQQQQETPPQVEVPQPAPAPQPAPEQPQLIAPAPLGAGGRKKGWVRPSEEPYVPPPRAPVTGPVKFSSHQV
jgi:hypothetical protein